MIYGIAPHNLVLMCVSYSLFIEYDEKLFSSWSEITDQLKNDDES